MLSSGCEAARADLPGDLPPRPTGGRIGGAPTRHMKGEERKRMYTNTTTNTSFPKLGEALYQARKRSGMTQDELAAALGVTHQSVSKWENGESCPDAQKLIAIAGVYGISLDRLCGGEEIPSSNEKTATPATFAEDAPAGQERKGMKKRLLRGISTLLLACALGAGGFFLGRGTVKTEASENSSLPLPGEVTVTRPIEFTLSEDKSAIICRCDCSATAPDYTYRLLVYTDVGKIEQIAFPATRESGEIGITAAIPITEDSIIGTDCRLRSIVLSVSDGLNERQLPLAELLEYDHFSGNILVTWV